MGTVGSFEARAPFSRRLDRVARGEEIASGPAAAFGAPGVPRPVARFGALLSGAQGPG